MAILNLPNGRWGWMIVAGSALTNVSIICCLCLGWIIFDHNFGFYDSSKLVFYFLQLFSVFVVLVYI
jgi:hypothetical protein